MKIIQENPNILNMNPAFNNAREDLEEWINDLTKMVNGRRFVFGEEVVEDNTLFTLTSITAEQQPGVTKVLKALLQGILDVVNRQLHSQPPGKKFWDPTPALHQAATIARGTQCEWRMELCQDYPKVYKHWKQGKEKRHLSQECEERSK